MTVQVRRTYTHTTCVTYVRHHAWSPTPMCTALRVKERRPRPRLPLKQRIPHSFSPHTSPLSLASLFWLMMTYLSALPIWLVVISDAVCEDEWIIVYQCREATVCPRAPLPLPPNLARPCARPLLLVFCSDGPLRKLES